MIRIDLQNRSDHLFGAFFSRTLIRAEIRNLPVQIREATRKPDAVNKIRSLIASADENFTGEHLSSYVDVESLNEEIAAFVRASRTLAPKVGFYFSYYLSSGNAALCVNRKDGKFGVELRTLKPKQEYDFSNIKKYNIKRSNSANNINPGSLGRMLFPSNLHYHPMEFLYFLSDFDEIMTGKKLESYTFDELQEFASTVLKFMKNIGEDGEPRLYFKLSNGTKAVFDIRNSSEVAICFDPQSSELMEKLNKQFPGCAD